MRTSTTLRRATAALATGLLSGALLLAGATGASADPFRCGSAGSDPNAWCTTVKTSVTTLNIRSGPGTGYGVVGTVSGGQRIEVDCWAPGTSVGGVTAWTKLYNSGYVSDYYLNTGIVKNFLPRC
ncbi:SH3 domain-containing protein [Cellulomonas sp. GbtcB1]|uniref:SH3 domain-containing protein n=1 Tax=unclassified Cellulomonas TaxID=2620175 RepID=UPI001C2F2421|nr:SH3 domain-containing protein [Cellulomonas sp. GbtcB1]